jgi:hypothetical protein
MMYTLLLLFSGMAMERFRRHLMLLTVLLVAFLIYASILSAFHGAARASVFFNSMGMSVFWVALLAALVVSFVAFKPLRRSPGSLMVHLACILIIAGSMYGSKSCHLLRQKYLGETRIYDGYLMLHEGYSENRLISEDESAALGELPFHMALKKFIIEYYPSPRAIQPAVKQYRSIAVVSPSEGKELQLRIAVNEPVTYGGYTFYQSSWGEDALGRYTVLHVRALSGIPALYTGYALLCAGLVWSLWIKNLLPAVRRYRGGTAYAD